ncbi:HD domain-containing protein [Undibacterium sp. FT137W]|uniref:HD domain-containing protein n=1 Tax=Undibacterium fentianense TaxID=2828728 RepID=A0A941DZZ2_9BURK|nr:HD domain-containing protein [Undibacterium fentianense]
MQVENWALSAFAGAVQAISKAETLSDVLSAICTAITTNTPFMLAWIGLAIDDEEKTVRNLGCAGEAEGYLRGVTISWDENSPYGRGPTGICLRSQTVQILSDAAIDQHFSPWLEKASQFGLRSSLSVPLKHPDGRAALVIYSREPNAFSQHVLPVFESLAVEIANGIEKLTLSHKLEHERLERAASQKQLDEALYQTIRALALTLESRDPYTAGHEERVADIACAIAQRLGWEPFRIQGLRLAALVHDIGKIAVPSEILTKPSRLNPAEMALIREHPETGYRILKDIPFPWPIARIVREHHEKIDGSGYPQGLKGNEILEESRILAIADIMESMASFRPYRPALGINAALREIRLGAGSQLDASIVDLCETMQLENPDVFMQR